MRKKAFSLVELLVVVAIIGILSTVVFVSYGGSQARSRDSKRRADVQQIAQAMELYKADNKVYLSTIGNTSLTCSSTTTSWWYCGVVVRGETTGQNPESWSNSTFASSLRPYLSSFPTPPKFDSTLALNDLSNYWYILYSPYGGDKYYLKANLELAGIAGVDMSGETCAGATGGRAMWSDGSWSGTEAFCVAQGRCSEAYTYSLPTPLPLPGQEFQCSHP
jgi:prepilin-type N-terminal cleavage/methylation domain-containing protein